MPLDALPLLDPLKLLLKTLGISVEHLVEGLRKCVNELTPEASEAVKKLLVTTACGANLVKGQGLPTLSSPLPPDLFSFVNLCFPVVDCTHTHSACPGISGQVQCPQF